MSGIKSIDLAKKIFNAKRAKKEVFPNNDIPTLVELAVDVCSVNFMLYPELEGIDEG